MISNHLTDNWQKALNLTSNWQMAKILTDNWHLFPPIQTLLFVREIRLDTPFTLYLSSLRFTRSNELNFFFAHNGATLFVKRRPE